MHSSAWISLNTRKWHGQGNRNGQCLRLSSIIPEDRCPTISGHEDCARRSPVLLFLGVCLRKPCLDLMVCPCLGC